MEWRCFSKPVLQFLGNAFDLFQTTIVLTVTGVCVCVIFKSLPHAYEKDSCIFDIWYPWSSLVLNSKGSAVETLPRRVTVTGVIYCPRLPICSLEAAFPHAVMEGVNVLPLKRIARFSPAWPKPPSPSTVANLTGLWFRVIIKLPRLWK